MSIDQLIERLLFQLSIHDKNRPLIIGIDGLGGSGKTTLSNKIEKLLIRHKYKLVTIHLDDHIVERNKRYQTGHKEWYEYYYLQWDVKSLVTNLFKLLHNNCGVLHLPFYNKNKDSVSTKQKTVAFDNIVLIEGIFLQRREWRDFYDFVIYVDCSGELRQQRVINRDSYIGDYQAILNKYQNRYWPGEKYYLNNIKPANHADLVYNT